MKSVTDVDILVEAIKRFRSGKAIVNGRKTTKEEVRKRLEAIYENGVFDFEKDRDLYRIFYVRAHSNNSTIKEEVEKLGYTSFQVKLVTINSPHERIGREQHILNIKDCIKDDVVVNLRARYPKTYNFLVFTANRQNLSVEAVVNQLLGVPDGTYLVYNETRASAFDMGSDGFIGNDEEIKNLISKIIRENMTPNGYISWSADKNNVVKQIINSIAMRNNIPYAEAVWMFVPEARVDEHHYYSDDKDIIKALSNYDDGTGNIDAIKTNLNLTGYIFHKAKENNLSIYEYVKRLGNFYFTREMASVDIEDYIRVKLYWFKKENGNLSGISRLDQQLYRVISRYRLSMPGGKSVSMQETIESFGYQFNGRTPKTKKPYTLEEIKELVDSKWVPGETINGLKNGGDDELNRKIYSVIIDYSKSHGMSVKEVFALLGHEYLGKAGENVNKRLLLKPSEYERYLELKEMILKEENGISEESEDLESDKEPNEE